MSSKFVIKIAVFSLLLTFPLIAFSKKAENKKNNSASKKLLAAAPRQNELLVIGALKSLYTAEAAYFSTIFSAVGNRNFGSLPQLYSANLIDATLATGEKYGYLIKIQTTFSYSPQFIVSATPKSYGKTGKRSFYFDASCVVHGSDKNGAETTVADAVIETCTPTLAYDNEREVIQAMRSFFAAEETYKRKVGNGNYTDFRSLYLAGLINSWLASGTYYNYGFQYQRTAPYPPFPATIKVWSVPYPYGQMGFRSFYIDNAGVLHGADRQGGRANQNDPPIEESKVEN